MAAVNRQRIIRDSALLLRDLLLNNITDPNTAGRTGNSSRFVTTSWPSRDVIYPVITVEQSRYSSVMAGTSTTESIAKIGMEVNVWTKNVGQKDSLAGSVIGILETQQDLIKASGLFDLRFTNITNADEPGPNGVHRKVLELEFLYPSQ